MDDLLKDITGGGSGQSNPAGGLDDLLGGLMGGGGLGSLLGAAGGSVTGTGGSSAGGLAALISTLLPAMLGMLGKGSGGQTGLHQLVESMQSNGLGNVAQSWVGNGAKQPITAAQVEQVFTSGQLAELASRAGIPADQVSSGIASILPHIVSSLTPSGSLPDAGEVQRAVGQLQQVLTGLTAGHS